MWKKFLEHRELGIRFDFVMESGRECVEPDLIELKRKSKRIKIQRVSSWIKKLNYTKLSKD